MPEHRDTDEGQRRLAELRDYRLGEIERGEATVFRRDDGGNVERIGYTTRLGRPGRRAWWVIAEPPLAGLFYPWVDGPTSAYRTRGDAVAALVRADVRRELEQQD